MNIRKLFYKIFPALNSKHNIIILGSGRSGTSITGELFEYLPEYEYMFESQLVNFPPHSIIDENKQLVIKLPKGGERISEGLAFDLDELLSKFKNPIKIIWIVRNPLDTICSLKPGIEDNWSHYPRPPHYKELLDKPWYIKGAYHWDYINSRGYETVQDYGPILIIKYEDLLKNTKRTVSRILKFVNSPMNIADLSKYIDRITNHTKGSYQAKFQVQWFRKDHNKRINRYKENMKHEEIVQSNKIVKDTARTFGYSI